MTVRVHEARTSAELDDVFRLRHQVFVDEEHYMKLRPDGRIADRFDAYPSSTNIVAVADDQVVGAIRFMERSPAGVSTDEFFDFTGHVQPGARDGSSGMLVVARQYRTTPRLVVTMMGMGYLWAASQWHRPICWARSTPSVSTHSGVPATARSPHSSTMISGTSTSCQWSLR